jgi:hypothetical protein
MNLTQVEVDCLLRIYSACIVYRIFECPPKDLCDQVYATKNWLFKYIDEHYEPDMEVKIR